MPDPNENYYIVAREPGAENPAIPSWACRTANPASLQLDYPLALNRRDIPEVPGAFQLQNVLSRQECERLVKISETLGFQPDAAVSLPRSIRHNDSLTWIVDDATNDIIWHRCQPLLQDLGDLFDGRRALGLNARYRFYRYDPGDYFSAHTDGSWPGSRVIDGQLVANAYPDRWSQLSFLLFLSDGYEGGETLFETAKPAAPAKVGVRTGMGGALCFPHGTHPLHCVHASAAITSGRKYIIRSDVLFET